jgi:pyruvate-ferredoxin/flavodoxin oxidoreductase
MAIRAPYLVTSADFVACHQFEFVDNLDIAGLARPGGVLL